MQICDPGLENQAMGGKIIWQLFANKKHPVSKIFWMKYLKGGSLRNLKAEKIPQVTTIWNSCRKGIEHIQHQLYIIPGNGARIFYENIAS